MVGEPKEILNKELKAFEGFRFQICPGLTLIRYADFNKRHEVSPCFSCQLQHHSCLGIQTSYVTKCLQNAALYVNINCCSYPKLKLTLNFTFTLLLKIGSKCLDLKGHFVLDVKIGCASNFGQTWT